MKKEQTAIIGLYGSTLFSLFAYFLFCEFKRKITFTVLPKNKSHTQSVVIEKDCYGVSL
jgi:hypothetical protein